MKQLLIAALVTLLGTSAFAGAANARSDDHHHHKIHHARHHVHHPVHH